MEYPGVDDLPFFPLIKTLRADKVWKAFILAAIFQTILLSLTLVSKDVIDKHFEKGTTAAYILTIIEVAVVVIISYTVMYLMFGFGGGMLCTEGVNCSV